MSKVIDAVRAKYPQYADVPDDKLTKAIGDKYPAYLEQDPDFARDYQVSTFKAAEAQPPTDPMELARRNFGVRMQAAGGHLPPLEGTPGNAPIKLADGTVFTFPQDSIGFPNWQAGPHASTATKVTAGVYNTVTSVPNFALSPTGLATEEGLLLAPALLPAALAKYVPWAAKLGFGSLMTKEAAQQLGTASVTHDPQQITEGLGAAAFAGLPFLHQEAKPQWQGPVAQGSVLELGPRNPPPLQAKAAQIETVAPLTAEALKQTAKEPSAPAPAVESPKPAAEAPSKEPAAETPAATPVQPVQQKAPEQPLTPSEQQLPEWLKHNIATSVQNMEAAGKADKIENLAAQGKTAKEIANDLGVEVEDVRAVRSARGIPAQDEAGFAEWQKKKLTPETPATPTPAPVDKPTMETTPAAATAPLDAAINEIQGHIEKGQLTKKLAADALAKVYGGTMAEGKFNEKHMMDVVEVAMNRLLANHPTIDVRNDLKQAQDDLKDIRATLDKLPTQTARSGEQDKMQQFSTPPHLSYVANWVANLKPEDVVYEPSAGTGGLAAYPKKIGATVIANELSDRRADLLEASGIPKVVTRENAEHLNAILQPKIDKGQLPPPTAVVMNPPFSNAAKSGDTKNTMIGANHVEEALQLLPLGGRLVAIVGEGMAPDKPTFKAWWSRMSKEYNVRANIGVSGDEYRKYGTTFGNRLLVFDKTGPTPEGGTITGAVDKVDDLLPLLEKVRNERPIIEAQPAPAEPGRPQTPQAGENKPGAATDAPAHPDVRPGSGATGGAGDDSGGLQPEPQTPAVGPETVAPGDDRGGATEPAVADAAKQPEEQPAQPPAEGLSVEKLKAKGEQELKEHGVFSEYKPRKISVPGAPPPPSPLVESTAMAAVEPVDPTYTPNLPKDIVTSGKLSEPQLENIIYAGQAHEQMLPNGQRMGYFIGDGTGVGKGRQLAAIIMDNWNRGRKKALWVSIKSDLINDAKRDLGDLGFDTQNVIDFWEKGGRNIVNKPSGVAFVNYDSLRSANPGLDADGNLLPEKPGKKAEAEGKTKLPSRMRLLLDWLGKDFDGVIALDEAHKAGNAIDTKGTRGVKKASETGKTVVDLQKLFPKARVVYASATGATDITNLSYAERLGIWGPGTPFSDKRAFFNEIQTGGISAMELVSRDLKSMGRYMSRTLSFEGVTRRQLVHKLSPDQRKIYNTLSKGWQVVLSNVNQSMAETGAANDKWARGAIMAQLFGAQQRFYNQLLTALQMPSILEDAKAKLAEGNSIVLQLVNTNEATQDREIAAKSMEKVDNEDTSYLENLDLSPKNILLDYIDKQFPTLLYEPVEDEEGNVSWKPVQDKDGNPVQDPRALKRKQALMDQIALLQAPENPMEMVLNHFGPDQVAEITGRSQRVVNKLQPDGTVKKVLENRSKDLIRQEANDFRDGKRRVLVFSNAGGTGFSYHAGRTFKNQERRMHYLVQAGWRADEAMQGFGRTHRTNQASAPEYVLASTDIKGHQRFISTIARRLAELGALTSGERRSAGGDLFTEENNLENKYATDAVYGLFSDLYGGKVEGFNFGDLSKQMGFTQTGPDGQEINTLVDPKSGGLNQGKIPSVQQFLNRILALQIDEQNGIFDAFMDRLKNRIEQAKMDGSYDPGTQTLKALSIKKISDEVIYQHPDSTAKTRLVDIEHENPTDRIPWDKVAKTGGKNPVLGYVQRLNDGRVFALKEAPDKTAANGSIIAQFRRISPTGHGLVDRGSLRDRYVYGEPPNVKQITEEEAKAAWEKQYNDAPKTKKQRDTYVTGAFLPIWDRLKIQQPKVWQIKTDAGERLLGVHVPSTQVAELRKRMAAGAGATESPETAFTAILHQGKRIELANGWKLKRVLVRGEKRIEVEGVKPNQMQEFENYLGGFIERLNFQPRFFVPADEATGVSVLEKMFKKSPPMADEKATVPGGAKPPTSDISGQSEGPGAAASSEFQTRKPEERSELAQLTQAIKGGLPKGPVEEQMGALREAWDNLRQSAADSKEQVTQRLAYLRAMGDVLYDHLTQLPAFTDEKRATGRWDSALQQAAQEVREFARSIIKAVPSPRVREAMVNWIQADGDEALLRERAAQSKAPYQRGYADALKLTKDQKTLAMQLQDYFDAMLARAQEAGMLSHGVENYVNQVWQRENPLTNRLKNEFAVGRLNPNWKFAKKRLFDTYFEGEQLGYKPAKKDIAALVALYDESFKTALAARNFLKELSQGNATDGRPLVEPAGSGKVVGDEGGGRKYLVRQRTTQDKLADYKQIDHPALRGWKWVGKDEAGNPVLFQGQLLVHPELYDRLRNRLTKSAFRTWEPIPGIKPGATLLNVQSSAKQALLSLSGFHLVQEASHALGHRVDPTGLVKKLKPIDFSDPVTKALTEHGLKLSDYHAMAEFSEGLTSGPWINKLPFVGNKILKPYTEWLFQEYIPRLKITMAHDALERNRARYPGATEDQLLELTARQANAAFGGQNLRYLGRNPTYQDVLRTFLLAPDFLESRARFVGQALKPFGREQLLALGLLAATQYILARLINKNVDGEYHWDKPFKVVYRGKEYGLRTVPSDIEELITNTRQFSYFRISPLVGRGLIEYLTGRDDRGVQRTGLQQVEDIMSSFIPMSLHKRDDQTYWEAFLNSFSLREHRYSAVTEIAEKARAWAKANRPAQPFEEIYNPDQDRYRALRLALENGNQEQAQAAYDELKKTLSRDQIAKAIRTHYSRPFTGSHKGEAAFLKTLDAAGRQRYAEAQALRREQLRLFGKLHH